MYNLAVSFWLKKIHIVLEFHTACNLINDTVDNRGDSQFGGGWVVQCAALKY